MFSCALQVMRATYKTVKGLASVDFANMARQLASDLKVLSALPLIDLLVIMSSEIQLNY